MNGRRLKAKRVPMKAFVAGTSMLESALFRSWERVVVPTPHGEVLLRKIDGFFFLQRHGEKMLPPHKINHLANMWALKSLKVKKIVAINSVGSLHEKVKPGTFLIPDDFFAPCRIPTFFDAELRFTVPHMNESLAKRLLGFCRKVKIDARLGGVYIEAVGPRLETKAEIRFFRTVGDVVGMTLASEATLCMELRIPYVSVCSIDNYCNGITREPLALPEIARNAKKSQQALERLVSAIIGENGP